jgi:hypothetical protein
MISLSMELHFFVFMTFYFPIGLGNCSDDVTCFFGSILDKYTAPHETGEVKT